MRKYLPRICCLLGLITLLSCSKDDIPSDTPACVRDMITQMQKAPVRNPPGSISQYNYKGQVVYYIPPTCCDQYSVLMDVGCNGLCAPDGGFSGGGDGRCTDFWKVATAEKVIWKDDRK